MNKVGLVGPEVYVHVPKTAGSSLRQAVIDHHGPESTYIYSQATDKLIRADKKAASARPGGERTTSALERMPRPVVASAVFAAMKLKEFLSTSDEKAFARAGAIIGHFSVDRFAELQTSHAASMRTVVREPLARMISHYKNVQNSDRVTGYHANWSSGQDSSLDFKRFALSDAVQNFQATFTGTDVNRFELVGTTESFGSFLLAAGLVSLESEAPHVNRAKGSADTSIASDAGFMRDFREFHADDYVFYEAALERSRALE